MTGEGQAEQKWVDPSWMAPMTGRPKHVSNSASLLPVRDYRAFVQSIFLTQYLDAAMCNGCGPFSTLHNNPHSPPHTPQDLSF